ncbi:unnamed protein product [Acanthoscelides obtectus]|uniref:Uncharacterized protein n=1 Tax=Acanthoscelides obtectus TaxID=200917 RepID=A0A9P0JXB6_ACAOB|nr:unnamed protein product [Acanthoscelides obtectus]CAK1647064.1 hypothetical protein AOBTE_LOCUS15028 [Acanthoscelides obtectus]
MFLRESVTLILPRKVLTFSKVMLANDDVEKSKNDNQIQDDSQDVSLEHSEVNTVDNIKPKN